MILFRDDWARFPNATVDYDTSNKSFLRIAALYQEMGIKNCLFPLALLQPELKGIDPFDPDLDMQTKIKIGKECEYNYWYFIREVVRIPPNAGPNPIPYIANRGNIAVSWLFLSNIDSASIQPRQTGKSVSTDVLMDWIIYVAATNTTVNMITKDHILRTKNVERLKKIRDLLPGYISKKTREDSDNQLELTCKINSNHYLTAVAQNSESAANNLGRGLTSPIMHFDEAPFCSFIGITLPAALAAGTAAREEAKLNKRPFGNVFTTTAGKKDDRDGKYMYNLIHGGAVWDESFLDTKDRDELLEVVNKQSTGLKKIVNVTMSHRQLGKTDEWLFEAISNANASEDEANRDFFNVWTSGTQRSPLTTHLNDVIRKSEKDPVWVENSGEGYLIYWYISEAELTMMESTVSLVAGLDTSDAVGRDAIALTIVNTEDLSVVGVLSVNETNLFTFGKYLADFLVKRPNVTLVPERKSSAQTMIDTIIVKLREVGIDPFKRMYNVIADQSSENREGYRELLTPMSRRTDSLYDKLKKQVGFVTTGGRRELLYTTVLQSAAKNSGHLVRSKKLIAEVTGLVEKNGRIDHNNSGHDDLVIAWLLCHWFLTQTRNLDYYGIDANRVLCKVYGTNKELTPTEILEHEQKQYYQRQIEEIYERLGETTDDYLISQYEAKLKKLSQYNHGGDGETISIDALIKQATDRRIRESRRKQILDKGRQQMGKMRQKYDFYH